MVQSLITKFFGNKHDRDVKKMAPRVEEINAVYETLSELSDDELRAKTDYFKEEILKATTEIRQQIDEINSQLRSEDSTNGHAGAEVKAMDEAREELSELQDEELEIIAEKLDELLPEVFAVVKDTCRRLLGKSWKVVEQDITWDMIPYDVQLIGGIVLHEGKIAEMATGEGKTLVATLPLYLNALAGKGVHLVTVNDYLARRDCEWMGKVFEFLGMKADYITNDMSPEARQRAYAADITYGTNNEFGFDYLRDNMSISRDQQVQRGHHYSIVDEVDSVLVDEARTPLIISGPVESSNQQYTEMKPLVETVVRSQTLLVNRFVSEAEKLLKEGNEDDAGVLLLRAQRGAPKNKRLMKVMNEVGIKKLIRAVENEFMRDKRMPEIDEELFFAIDEKAHTIDLTDKGRQAMSPNDPEMFVLPDLSEKIHEIDIDEESSPEDKINRKQEVHLEYGAKADQLHSIQQLLKAYSLFEKDKAYVLQDGQVKIVDEFTGRIMEGRRYSDGLHQALEAKEGVKIQRETQTLATITLQNYFRMYSKLAGMTGTAETEANEFWDIYKLDVTVIPTNKPIQRVDHNDQVYKTKREKYNAVINDIAEKHERRQPVLVGTVSVEESETLSRMLKRRGIPHSVLNAKYHQKEAEIVQRAGQMGAVTIATNMAGRGTDIKLGPGVVVEDEPESGLYILGTSRHESRRIDRQLRGRAGRQGDPGASRFYLSLEDDLMRLFQSDRAASIMDRLGIEEGEVIEHKMITRSIERAQKRVEAHNFDIRKHLLEYDNVMNQQREVIYDRRNHALMGENLKEEIFDILADQVDTMVDEFMPEDAYEEQWDIPALKVAYQKAFLSEFPLTEDEVDNLPPQEFRGRLMEGATNAYNQKESALTAQVMRQIERIAMLKTIDDRWRDHLYEMDRMKEGIGLRAYGQKDPLIEYKGEGFRMFEKMVQELNREVVELIFRAQLQPAEAQFQQRRPSPQRMTAVHESASGMPFGAQSGAQTPPPAGKREPVVSGGKVGRNDPCPCGSGKKFKKCHGQNS